MNIGRWSAFVLIPIILILERFSYYGLRSVVFQDMSAEGHDPETIRTRVQTVTWLVTATPLLGGLIAIATKPRWTMVAGLVIAAMGYALLLALGSASLAGFVVLAVGLGLFRPAVYATMAMAARDPEESLRNGLFLLLYAATNVGGLAGPLLGSTIMGGYRPWEAGGTALRPFTFFSSAGALMLTLSAMLALAVAIAPRFGEEREPPDPPLSGRGEGAAFLVMFLALPALLVMTTADQLQFEPLYHSGTYSSMAWVFYVNPAVVTGVAIPMSIALGAAALLRKRIPALPLVAFGFLTLAIGCLPLLATSGPDDRAAAAALLSMVILAIGEAFAFPLAVSRMTGAAHPRTASLVVSIWLVVSGGATVFLTWGLRTAESDGLRAAGIAVAIGASFAFLFSIAAVLVHLFLGAKLWGSAAPAPGDAADDPPTLAPGSRG